jgi:DNA modification methylase
MTQSRCDIYNQDCIAGLAEHVPDDSVHLTVTSIPFEELFTYSGKLEDVGNNGSTIDIRAGRFALNMRFVVEQLRRVTAPGCNVCVHIQQLLAYKVQHGFMGRRDFRGAMIDVFTAGGMRFVGEVAIVKNPQSMAQRLSLHSLQFKTGRERTATDLAPAPNDYVLIFQKPGQISAPVRCIHEPRKNPRGWVTTDTWVKWAHGCWTDIDEFDVLDGWRAARESDEEKHVCPLQLEVIRRCVLLYTNPVSIQPDVTVLDPFVGIGSTPYVCLGGEHKEKGKGPLIPEPRNVVGFELKESYHGQALRNAEKARASFARKEKKERLLIA